MHEKVWGGHRLQPLKGLACNDLPIGESWEVSAVPTSESVVANGPLAGQTLDAVTRTYGAELLGQHIAKTYGNTFPLLVKFIDAQGDLSIQVHPNDALALARHGKQGKTEMWYVIEAEPGAAVYSGFRKAINEEEYRRRVEDGSIIDVLARHDVLAGDVFYIPAGRVHAICGGILLCEIQQSSDITYRLYDYKRLGLDGKPRQLHTQEALEALDFHVYDNYRITFQPTDEGIAHLIDCDYFVVNILMTHTTLHRNLKAKDSFVTLSCIKGDCRIRTIGGHTLILTHGHSCLIPACDAEFDIEALSSSTQVIEAIAK